MFSPVSPLIHECGTCSQCDVNVDALVIFNHALFLLTFLLCCLILFCVLHIWYLCTAFLYFLKLRISPTLSGFKNVNMVDLLVSSLLKDQCPPVEVGS